MSHSVAAFVEKLRFAFSWSDQALTLVSFLLLLAWSALLTAGIVAASLVPVVALRLAVAFVVYVLAILTDPPLTRKLFQPLLRRLAVVLVMNNSESVLVACLCQLLWDVGEPYFGSFNGPIDIPPSPVPRRHSRSPRVHPPCPTFEASPPYPVTILRSLFEFVAVLCAEGGMFIFRLLFFVIRVLFRQALKPFAALTKQVGDVLRHRATYCWWLRIPDARELEHRLLARSQEVDLTHLVPDGRDVDEYLETLFKRKGALLGLTMPSKKVTPSGRRLPSGSSRSFWRRVSPRVTPSVGFTYFVMLCASRCSASSQQEPLQRTHVFLLRAL